MEENFNGLTPDQTERLAILAEECGEVIQIVGKILRHGYDSYHPKDDNLTSNLELLEREIGDVNAILSIMCWAEDIDLDVINQNRDDKLDRINKYLHHFSITEKEKASD